METTEIVCPICKVGVPKKIIQTYARYEIIRCGICDIEFAVPFRQASAESYDDAYAANKRQGVFHNLISRRRFFHYDGFMDIYIVIYKILKPLNNKGKLLDAGCGDGYFLSLMRELGFDVYGFDFSRIAIDYAKQIHKLKNVLVCPWDKVPNDWRGFSIITALEVLEHLDKPLEFLSRMKDLLTIGGCLIVSVPNRERLGERSLYNIPGNYPPIHLTRWSKRALGYALVKAGFKKVIVKPLAPSTVALKEEFRFLLSPTIYGTRVGRYLTKVLSETVGRYFAFFARHLLWDRGAYLVGIAKNVEG